MIRSKMSEFKVVCRRGRFCILDKFNELVGVENSLTAAADKIHNILSTVRLVWYCDECGVELTPAEDGSKDYVCTECSKRKVYPNTGGYING